MAGNAGAVILIAPLLFDAAARPQRAARLVVRAEAEAAAAPKAAPKKEVGPSVAPGKSSSSSSILWGPRQLSTSRIAVAGSVRRLVVEQHQTTQQLRSWSAVPGQEQQAVLAALRAYLRSG